MKSKLEIWLECEDLEYILEEGGVSELEALECLYIHGLLSLPGWLEEDELPTEEE